MKYINKYSESGFWLLFKPSGELIEVTKVQFNVISDFIIMDYNTEYGAYVLNDDHRKIIVMALNDKKFDL